MILRSLLPSGRTCIGNASALANKSVGGITPTPIGPVARKKLGTSYTHYYHTPPAWDGAHRGLALPYPSDAPLERAVYEQHQPKTDDTAVTRRERDLAKSLPDVILAQDYNTAARNRIHLLRHRVVIPQHDAFEIMALRMLSRANNSYNKVRVNSFLAWWAMIPDHKSPSSPEMSIRTTTINRIIRSLTNLSPAECPNSALIRFGILAARKGYAEAVAERLISHIFMWSPPILSRKFFTDFVAAASNQSASTINAGALGKWYELAIRTQVFSGRYAEAKAILKEARRRVDVRVPSGVSVFLKSSGKKSYVLAPAVGDRISRISSSAHRRKSPQTNPSFAPPSPDSPSYIHITMHSLHQRHSPEHLASLIHRHITDEPLLHTLHDSLRNRNGASFRAHWQMHPFRMGYWATAEMIYHLRYCDDPLAAFHVYTMYYHNRSFVPPSLHSKLHGAWAETHDQLDSRTERLELFRRITGRGTAPSRNRARLMPRAHTTLPVLWEAVVRSGLASPRELREHFRAQIADPMECVDTSHYPAQGITLKLLRQLNTRRPLSKNRINIYSFSRPPIYKPRLAGLDTIISSMRPVISTPQQCPPTEEIMDRVVDESPRTVALAASPCLESRTTPASEGVKEVLSMDRVRNVAAEIGGSIFHRPASAIA
ncbi:hypothetical protein FRB93_006119 [Tulasnella sp. JGI-2019a]|nr:hypothetical protein FRB93_006119 [Tulasnella sp. JGI-2019a]